MRGLPPGRGRNYGAATMNDADENQSASGSWQPDPTGRYKLRWRDAAGNWTDHVYSSEGEMGNDPYNAPTEQHPPQDLPTPPTETPLAAPSERIEANDTGPLIVVCGRCGHTDFVVKRDRVLWHVCFWLGLWLALPFLRKRPYCARCGLRGEWLPPTDGDQPKPPIYRRWWAFVLYGFVILVVIANLVDVDEDEESAESAPAPSAEQEAPESDPATAAPTTAAPTTAALTTAAPTTTSPPTTQAASSVDDCTVRLELLDASFELVTTFSGQMEAELAAGDLFALQETYDLTKWMMDDLPSMSRDFIDDCGHLYPQSLVDESERAMESTEASWQFVRQVCRSDLAPLGFEC